MKKITLSLLVLAALLPSCKKNNDTTDIRQAIVTVKGEKGAECLLQLDEATVLKPDNLSENPYGKQVRALVIYNDKGETEPNSSDYTYRKVEVARMDSILTKGTVKDLGTEQNDSVYGTAPLGVYDSWMTVVEDGYITLHFVGIWGSYPIPCKHTMNLVDLNQGKGSSELNFEFRHNYNDDQYAKSGIGYYRNGVVAFDISKFLDGVDAKTFKINVKFYGLSTVTKTITFNYTRGTSTVLGTNSSESSGVGSYLQ